MKRLIIISTLLLFLIPIILFITLTNSSDSTINNATTKELEKPLEIIEKISMPEPLYVQGLEIINNQLVVGTGLYGQSSIGTIEKDHYNKIDSLNGELFGEGITSDGEYIYQATWREGKLLKRDINTYETVEEFNYDDEGWGLCYNGEHIIKSNGSNVLSFHNKENFNIEKTITTTRQNINELECVENYIYANVWLTNDIIKIDSTTGDIIQSYNLDSIQENPHSDGVLNGIAHIQDNQFYITGKDWENYYIIELK